MDEHVPGVRAGISRLRLLNGVDGFLNGVVAVGMDGDLASAPVVALHAGLQVFGGMMEEALLVSAEVRLMEPS